MLYACRDRHPNELSEIVGGHFFHEARSMDLDRTGADPELEADFLV